MTNTLANQFRQACLIELEALKPGNVSVYSAGHGMQVEDFRRSADVAADPLTCSGFSVGTRVLKAIAATRQAVGCNTNLGIVLLCAPLALAAEQTGVNGDMRAVLQNVLLALSRDDAQQVFDAIRLAQPAGLGDSAEHDVRETAQVTLLEAMQFAARRDQIAWQYANGFEDVFATGVPCLQDALVKCTQLPWAVVGVYLQFLATWPDSHIARKYGDTMAEQVCREAQPVLAQFIAARDKPALQAMLLAFDQSLKQRGMNPGTSADLTVATVFAALVQGLVVF